MVLCHIICDSDVLFQKSKYVYIISHTSGNEKQKYAGTSVHKRIMDILWTSKNRLQHLILLIY